MARSGALPISIVVMPHAAALLQGADPHRWEGPVTGEGDENVRVGAVKLFADGGVVPAIDVRIGGVRMNLGMVFPDLEKQVLEAAERGFGLAVHAIGNAGPEQALEAFATLRRLRLAFSQRLRVEHACLASVDQWRRMADLGVVGVVQPGFVRHVGRAVEDVRFDDARWLAFGSAARAGVLLAASSDDPYAFFEPLQTAAYGATRLTASGRVFDVNEALSYEDWLRACTLGAATAGGQEAERGSLTPGKRADLLILEGPLDPHNPPRVAGTWVAGHPVAYPWLMVAYWLMDTHYYLLIYWLIVLAYWLMDTHYLRGLSVAYGPWLMDTHNSLVATTPAMDVLGPREPSVANDNPIMAGDLREFAHEVLP